MLHVLRRLLDELRLDVVYAARTFVRTRAFVIAALSLGLAAGATSAVYVTADWLLYRPPGGVVQPEALAGLRLTERGREAEGRFGFSYPQYLALREVQDAFVDVAAYAKILRVVQTDEWIDEVVEQYVSGSYFPLLGVRPYLGRLVGPDDDVDGTPPLAVLSYAFWKSRFGGDPGVIGTSMRFGTTPGVIIGVLPPEFEDHSLDWNGPTQLWLPMRSARGIEGMAGMLTMTQTFFPIVGRLAPGVDLDAAAQRAQRWLTELPPVSSGLFDLNAISLAPEAEMRIARREDARSFLNALLIICVVVLLAASVSVANILMGRAAARRRELALRAALGATRGRIVRQILAESFLLATAAAAAAVVLGASVGALLAPLPEVYLDLSARAAPLTTAGALDGKMAALAAALAFVASCVLGLMPVFGTFTSPMASLEAPGPRWRWSRVRVSPSQVALALQAAVAVVLVVTAGLFAVSFARAASVDPEYAAPESVLMARLVPVHEDEVGAFNRAVVERVEAVPGVVSVAWSYNPPFAGGRTLVSLPEEPDASFEVGAAGVGPRYFETVGIELIRGREFTWREGDEDGAVVNTVLADRLWPGQEAVGQTFVHSGGTARVVGVVAHERCREALGEPAPCVWSLLPMASNGGTLHIRTAGNATRFLPSLRGIVDRLSPDVPIVEEQALSAFLARFIRAERTAAAASFVLASFAMILLGAGCISVFMSMVRDDLRELCIRMALGATRERVTARVVAQGALVLAAGAAIGVVAARLVAVPLAPRLYQTAPTDPGPYAWALALTAAVGFGGAAHAAFTGTRTPLAEQLQRE